MLESFKRHLISIQRFFLISMATGFLFVFYSNIAFAIDSRVAQVVENRTGAEKSIRLIEILDKNQLFKGYCTGTFISENVMLTAAHCLETAFYFRDVETGVTTKNNFFLSPYGSQFLDVGLIKFPDHTYVGDVFKVNIAYLSNQKIEFTTYGYGIIHIKDKSLDHKLRKSSGMVYFLDTPGRIGNIDYFGTMPGDSGGPLVDNISSTIIGITSTRDGYGRSTWHNLVIDSSDEELSESYDKVIRALSLQYTTCECIKRTYREDVVKYRASGRDFYRTEYKHILNEKIIAISLPLSQGNACQFLNENPGIDGKSNTIESCRSI